MTQRIPVLVAIARAVQLREQAQELIDLRVSVARLNGHSWRQIADALGVSKQAAWEHYERFDDPALR